MMSQPDKVADFIVKAVITLAGLSAAYALAKRKWEVTVVEAREWTGGRVYSFRFPQAAELVCELGGEWVG